MDQTEVLTCEERLRVAMLCSDIAELDRLLSSRLVFTTFLGEVIDKQRDLDAHRSGSLRMHSVELSDIRVMEVGGGMAVTCCAEIDASFDGDRTKKSFRFSRVWVLEDGEPRVLLGQATLVYSSLLMEPYAS